LTVILTLFHAKPGQLSNGLSLLHFFSSRNRSELCNTKGTDFYKMIIARHLQVWLFILIISFPTAASQSKRLMRDKKRSLISPNYTDLISVHSNLWLGVSAFHSQEM
jgi:hypothetical protein